MIASETADLKTAGKPLNQALNGRGGGNGKFLQGTYKAPKAEIEKALNAAFNA
jgi:alanyl-tRNA synthetase